MNDRIDESRSRNDGVVVPRIWVAFALSILLHVVTLLVTPRTQQLFLPPKGEDPDARAALGWEYGPFEIPADIKAWWEGLGARGKSARAAWEARLAADSQAGEFNRRMAGELPGADPMPEYLASLVVTPPKVATRKSSEMALDALVPALPELPTVSESGLKGYQSSQWYGILAPAGTPPEILNLLNGHAAKIMHTPEMKERMKMSGSVAVGSSREMFSKFLQTEFTKWAKVIKDSGAKVD